MNNQKHIKDIVDAIYDHRFVSISLTNGRLVKGRISGMSDTTFRIGLHPGSRNSFSLDLVESVKLY